jgi:hypothetical protein
MKRKIGLYFVILVTLSFLSLSLYSIFIQKDPINKEFRGVVKMRKRLYPGLVVFKFQNSNKKYRMARNLDEFYNSISIGDSIVKPKGDPYIYIFIKRRGKYVLYKEFIYD